VHRNFDFSESHGSSCWSERRSRAILCAARVRRCAAGGCVPGGLVVRITKAGSPLRVFPGEGENGEIYPSRAPVGAVTGRTVLVARDPRRQLAVPNRRTRPKRPLTRARAGVRLDRLADIGPGGGCAGHAAAGGRPPRAGGLLGVWSGAVQRARPRGRSGLSPGRVCRCAVGRALPRRWGRARGSAGAGGHAARLTFDVGPARAGLPGARHEPAVWVPPGPCAGGLLGRDRRRARGAAAGPLRGRAAGSRARSASVPVRGPLRGRVCCGDRLLAGRQAAGPPARAGLLPRAGRSVPSTWPAPPHGRACCPPRVTGGKLTA